MARSIDEYQSRSEGTSIADYADRGTTRSTARAFAAAISALAISALVITSSSDALKNFGTLNEVEVKAGVIKLADDDSGQSLFSIDNLGPNDVETKCIEITYEGSLNPPIELTMATEARGQLVPFLSVTVEEGVGGGFDNCSGFVSSSLVFDGRLGDLADAEPLELATFRNRNESVTYRFAITMDDVQEAVDKTGTFGFTWEATQA